MGKYPPLYEWSLEEAIHNNEQGLWRESYRENCDCARAIERAIEEHHHDNVLEDCVQPLIDRYGFDRVNWVLANTVQQKMEDGRFSPDNKTWARGIYIPHDNARWHFCVESHPGLTDLFLNQARRVWQALGLFDRSHCLSEKNGLIDYTDQVTVLKPTVLNDKFKTPEDQLFLAESGFGYSPDARGQKVFGTFLKDGEEAQFNRQDFLGVLMDEYLPDWARESLAKIRAVQAPDEDEGMTMSGM